MICSYLLFPVFFSQDRLNGLSKFLYQDSTEALPWTDSRLITFQLPHTDRSPLSQVVTRRCLHSKILELSLWWKRSSFCIPAHLYSIEECLVYKIPECIDFIFQRMEAVGQFRNKMGCYYRPSVCCSRSFCSQCSTWWAAGPPQTLLFPHPGLGTRHQRSSCA